MTKPNLDAEVSEELIEQIDKMPPSDPTNDHPMVRAAKEVLRRYADCQHEFVDVETFKWGTTQMKCSKCGIIQYEEG